MRYRLHSLLAVVAIAACVLGWMLAAGWFTPDFENANNKVRQKLECSADLQMINWTVADLAFQIEDRYKIPTSVGDIDATLVLDDVNIASVRLKNSIRLALRSQNLTYAIQNGKLEIVGLDDPNAVLPQDVYSHGDLVAPNAR